MNRLRKWAAYAALMFMVALCAAVAFVPEKAHAQYAPTASGSVTTQNLVPAGAATAGSAVEVILADSRATVTAQITGTYTASGGLSAQVTTDGSNWITLGASSITRMSTGVSAATITSGEQDVYSIPAAGFTKLRITALGAVTGTATITLRASTAAAGSSATGVSSVTIPGTVTTKPLDGASVGPASLSASKTATVTISNASPAVITWTGHALTANTPIVLTTSGSLPTPLVATNTVYVLSVLDANTFTVSLTPGGTAINTSSGGSGTQTATANILWIADLLGYQGATVNVTSAGTSCTITYEGSDDQTTWVTVPGAIVNSFSGANATGTSTTANYFYFPKRLRYFRARVTTYTSGTVTAAGSLMATANAVYSAVGISGNASVVGAGAHAAAISGAPARIGARGRNFGTPYTAVTVDQTTDLVTDFVGNLKTTQEFSFSNITSNATTTVKSGAGLLHTLCINTKGASANTATIYDNTAGSGTKIGTLDTTAGVQCLTYDAVFATGLTIVTATGTAADITVSYR